MDLSGILFRGLPWLAVAGCASTYRAPGRGADLSVIGVAPAERVQLTDESIRETLEKHPLAPFPGSVAVVRVQETGYRAAIRRRRPSRSSSASSSRPGTP